MKGLKDNSLTIGFLLLFFGALIAQAIAGHAAFNADQLSHGGQDISLWSYVVSASYGAAVLENWQSEYLQFTLYILLTVWLIQRGSPESKEPGKAGGESDKEQQLGPHAEPDSPTFARSRGFASSVYSNSLVAVMGFIWLCSWLGQSLTGWTEFSDQRMEHLQTPLTWTQYLGSPDFWERTFQNWQSEFLAVASMSILAVYLRQRGSPESKPVGASHEATSVEA
jgi:membrane protein implicated in regulation of membrane protease activity